MSTEACARAVYVIAFGVGGRAIGKQRTGGVAGRRGGEAVGNTLRGGVGTAEASRAIVGVRKASRCRGEPSRGGTTSRVGWVGLQSREKS